MNSLWVANDNNKQGDWKLSKTELLSMISNVLFVEKFYPSFKRILFLDDFTKKYFEQFRITSLFDEINLSVLNKNYKINSKIFWAFSKLLCQRATKGPTVIFDLDFRLFKDLNKINFFHYDIGAYSFESIDGKYYYSTPEHCLENIIINKNFDWDRFAISVCCLYIKDNDFKNEYCDFAIDYMYQWTSNHKNDDKLYGENYILFVEQYMLAQHAKRRNKKVGVIVGDEQDGELPSYGVDLGLTKTSYTEYVYHYGTNKPKFDYGSDFYNLEVETIRNFANENIKNQDGLDILNDIANLKDDEGCFRKLD